MEQLATAGSILLAPDTLQLAEGYVQVRSLGPMTVKGLSESIPVYELLGGPTRQRIRVYAHARTPEQIKQQMARGFTAFKTGPAKRRPARCLETPAEVRYAAEKFAATFPGAVGQPWVADHGVLFESKLSPKGPRYRAVAELPLAGTEEPEA